MFKNLCVVFAAMLCGGNTLYAQNVFNPLDPVVLYNSAAIPGSVTNPNLPAAGVMAKWVKTTRVSWNTSSFKPYIWNGMAFRLRYPNNYNPANAVKYPVVVFFHGGGETGVASDNEDQLVWGAQVFEQRINNSEWNGFLLFPQETYVGWDDNYFSRINGVLDSLQKYANADPDRVISMGLSSGGAGAMYYSDLYPQRVAATLAASPASVRSLSADIPNFLHIPLWMANGGIDINPGPWDAATFYSQFRNAGGNVYQTYFVEDAHNCWTDMWNQKNGAGVYFTTAYWNNAHKAQPMVYYQNQQFCTGAVSARMALSPGFYAYQWSQNGTTIAGANGNEYTATQQGQYRARFMRTAGSAWSAWSPAPVVISTKTCAVDTLYAEHFNADNYYNAEAQYKINNFGCQNGVMTSGTDLFTQDATGIQGNRFLVNFTSNASGCVYNQGDRVWNTYSPVLVTPNTNYEYSFYMGNQNAISPAQLVPTINGIPLTTVPAQATGTGNSSWTKFTYTWNSGGFPYADLGIINKSIVTTGNDFAIDEICLKLAPVLPVPLCTSNILPANGSAIASSNTVSLTWNPAANASSYDLYLWTGLTAPASPIANITGTSYTATGLTATTGYNWYVVPRNATMAATGCSSNKTNFTTASAAVLPGTGTGLKADYYNSIDLTGSVSLTKTDATVNFNWGAGSPSRSIDANTFSARWTGFIQPQYSETYTFYTTSDDGIRLWINGEQVINNWTLHGATENSGSITLKAGVKYTITMEYYESTGDATAQLSWSGASTPKAIIPQKQLYLPTDGGRIFGANERVSEIQNPAEQIAQPALLLKAGIYPNPARRGQPVTVQLNSQTGGTATVQIAGIAGNLIQLQKLGIVTGGNTRLIQTAGLAPGIYFLRVSGGADLVPVYKLVIQ